MNTPCVICGTPVRRNGSKACSPRCAGRMRKPVTRRPQKTGYMVVQDSGRARHEHDVIAERVLGRALCRPEQVHHVDGNRSNNINCNLVICPNDAYHKLLHARLRIVAAGGDPNKDKICTKCRAVKSRSDFWLNPQTWTGRAANCIACEIYKDRDFVV